jgi:hypothetical protein
MSAVEFRPGETFKAARARTIREDAADYGLTLAEAEGNLMNHHGEWMEGARQWLKGGAIPSQAWINSTREAFPEWWERRVCHDCPDVCDRLAKAGRSLYRTQAARAATWA